MSDYKKYRLSVQSGGKKKETKENKENKKDDNKNETEMILSYDDASRVISLEAEKAGRGGNIFVRLLHIHPDGTTYAEDENILRKLLGPDIINKSKNTLDAFLGDLSGEEKEYVERIRKELKKVSWYKD